MPTVCYTKKYEDGTEGKFTCQRHPLSRNQWNAIKKTHTEIIMKVYSKLRK